MVDENQHSPLRNGFKMSEVNLKASLLDAGVNLNLPLSVRNTHKLDFAQKDLD